MNFLRGVMGGPSAGPQPSGADTVREKGSGRERGPGLAGPRCDLRPVLSRSRSFATGWPPPRS